jgi:hypothetical protein
MKSSVALAEAFERTWIAHKRRFLADYENVASELGCLPI